MHINLITKIAQFSEYYHMILDTFKLYLNSFPDIVKALADFAFFMPFTFWPSLMLGLDIDLKSSSYVMGVVGICDMIGRIGIGRLVDR